MNATEIVQRLAEKASAVLDRAATNYVRVQAGGLTRPEADEKPADIITEAFAPFVALLEAVNSLTFCHSGICRCSHCSAIAKGHIAIHEIE